MTIRSISLAAILTTLAAAASPATAQTQQQKDWC